jgi:hypothetical protein
MIPAPRKKLSLNKTTLRSLSASQLARVAGGQKKTNEYEVCSYSHQLDGCDTVVSLHCVDTDLSCYGEQCRDEQQG